MKQDTWKNTQNKGACHQAGSLFREWPTPSDTVAGFGGDPEKVADKQWKMKNGKSGDM